MTDRARAFVRSPRWIVVLVIVAVLAMLASVPIVWHLSMRSRVDRLDASIARRTAEYLSFPGEARDGDRDCDTSEELARRLADARATSPSDELVGAVRGALACRRAWNAEPTDPDRIEPRISAWSIVPAYLEAVESEDPDACLEGATTALRLAERLAAGADANPSALGYAVERMTGCVGRASPAARAAALAALGPLALDPQPAWFTIEPAALRIATIYATDARERIGVRAFVASATRPSAVLEAQRSERRAYEVLSYSDESRDCDDVCIARLEMRSRSYPAWYGPGGPSRPMQEATQAVLWSRTVLRAAVVALDDGRVSDPRLASPWDGTPMRVLHEGDGVRVEWSGPGGPASVPDAPSREP